MSDIVPTTERERAIWQAGRESALAELASQVETLQHQVQTTLSKSYQARAVNRCPRIQAIKSIVARHYDIRLGDLDSGERRHGVSRPRSEAMALACWLTSWSLPDIGRAFGGRDHTTVMHARDVVHGQWLDGYRPHLTELHARAASAIDWVEVAE